MKYLIFIMFFCSSLCVHAETEQIGPPSGKFCDTRDGRLQYVSKYIPNIYSSFSERIENVPPDIDSYIEKEYREIMSAYPLSEGRFELLTKNQYWYAWQFRSELNELVQKAKVGPLMNNSSNPNLLKSEVLFYISLEKLNRNVMSKLDNYIQFDSKRAKRLLNFSDNPYASVAFLGLGLEFNFERLIDCAFAT